MNSTEKFTSGRRESVIVSLNAARHKPGALPASIAEQAGPGGNLAMVIQ